VCIYYSLGDRRRTGRTRRALTSRRHHGVLRGDRDAPVLCVVVHVRVLPEQPVAAEGVQLDRAVRRVHRRRGERPAHRVRHLLVESVNTVHHSHCVDHTRG